MMAQMFMENGPQQHAVENVEQVGELEEKDAIGRQQIADSIGHAAEVVGVCEDVERADNRGMRRAGCRSRGREPV